MWLSTDTNMASDKWSYLHKKHIYIAKRFSNPRKKDIPPCDGDGKRKYVNLGTDVHSQLTF